MGTDVRIPLTDSGWILPSLATDITVNATWAHLGYRRIGKILYLTLALDVANPAADKLVFTLPAGFRPSGSVRVLGVGATGIPRINPTNGEVRTHSAATTFFVSMSLPLT